MDENEALRYLEDAGMSYAEMRMHLKSGLSLSTVAEAVQSRAARGVPPLGDDEDEDRDEKKKDERPVLTMSLLREALAELNVSVRYNVISKEVEIEGLNTAYNPEALAADLHVIIHDNIKHVFKCNKDQVADLLHVIAGVNRFNPVTELLDGVEWDHQDRLPELFAILGLGQRDTLSKILVSKWLLQCVAMSRNELKGAYGADGVLVLTGPQGIGKTTLVKTLGMRPDLYKLGQWLDTKDKDTFRRCTSAWIVELGELETTLRSDLERLKAFITAERDEYRLPYGRADQILARRTSLVATCNSQRFLIDPTGSRRFWTVPVEKIDLDRLARLDVLQLWKEMDICLDGHGQDFRLTRLQQEGLYQRNASHEKPLKAQSEVEDILAEAESQPESYVWTEMTVSDFKAEHNLLRGYSVEQIGKALEQVGISVQRVRTDGRQIRVRRLPKRRVSW